MEPRVLASEGSASLPGPGGRSPRARRGTSRRLSPSNTAPSPLWYWVTEELCPVTGCIFQRWPPQCPLSHTLVCGCHREAESHCPALVPKLATAAPLQPVTHCGVMLGASERLRRPRRCCPLCGPPPDVLSLRASALLWGPVTGCTPGCSC